MKLSLALVPCLLVVARAQVVINEIHYAPDVKQERVEFIELHNPGGTNVPLAGWRFSSGIQFTFPAGAVLGAGGYAVVAENPAALAQKFGATGAFGPWTGKLTSSGENLVLRDAADAVADQVDYQLGFPWPTVGDAPGYSIELINPALDNSVGGSWRASTTGIAPPTAPPLIEAGATWRYFKGTAEPSQPLPAWREPAFNDSGWASGAGPLGYDPAVGFGTALTDMRGNYRQFYLRGRFTVAAAAELKALRLEVLFDDGFKVWLNGVELRAVNLPLGDVPFDTVATGGARESNNYEVYDLVLPPNVLRAGENVLAFQVANVDFSNSSDCFLDARLKPASAPAGVGATPGQRNRSFATNAPPAIRQVAHFPRQPHSGEATLVSARVTDPDGVGAVTLEYQPVEPGNYLEISDSAYSTTWTMLPMTRDTTDTNVFVVALPPELIQHRNLVRYRITATDGLGALVRTPYADDPQPNFALFVYDGVPAWNGAVRPGDAGALGTPFTVGTNEMNRLPVYHLIAKKKSVEDCTWRDRSHGDEYFWNGTLVYDGEVYDHIRMRPRGGVWRYAMGKNMWKFDFNRGHDFQPRDNWGRKLGTPWGKLNLGACIQQGDFEFRGEQGLFESVGFRLFQLAGQPAEHTSFVQFRVIDEPEEAKANDQFGGDFWGLYLALEQPDGRFLEEHGLPDGNLYKMEGGGGDANNLGPDGPVDESDLNAFQNAYLNQSASLTESWWRTNFNLATYFNYQAIVQGIHHYDIADGKNYYFYRDPTDGRWMTVVWDLDLTWADNMYRGGQTGGDEPFKSRVLSGFNVTSPRYPNLAREFRNRVREIRDLLWNGDEAGRLIDEYARLVRGTNGTSIIDADRAQWDYNPIMVSALINPSKAGQGRFYRFSQASGVSKTFEGTAQWMKRYVGYRGTNSTFSLDTMSRETDRPAQPTLSYIGATGFPVNRLSVRASAFAGAAAFSSVKFRVAEVTRPDHPAYRPDLPLPYEITAAWESGDLTNAVSEVVLPQEALRVGRLYRARVRYTDSVGRASNWSPPVEFTAGEPDNGTALVTSLRLTELMYNPVPAGFEFLELHNTSETATLRLDGANFTAGLDYTFPTNSLLAPGGYAVVIGTTNRAGFLAHHRLGESVPIFGPFDGNLSNGGETVTLKTSAGGAVIFSATYDDAAPWPSLADGLGHSLVPADGGGNDLSSPAYWRSSLQPGGSPGRADSDGGTAFAFAPPVVDGSSLKLQFNTDSGRVWVLETSADFTQWSPQATNTGPAMITWPLASVPEHRFLRAVAR